MAGWRVVKKNDKGSYEEIDNVVYLKADDAAMAMSKAAKSEYGTFSISGHRAPKRQENK